MVSPALNGVILEPDAAGSRFAAKDIGFGGSCRGVSEESGLQPKAPWHQSRRRGESSSSEI